MSWTHLICDDCWDKKNPDLAAVTADVGFRSLEPAEFGKPTLCCFCSEPTRSGIYVRHDQAELSCSHDGWS